MQTRKEIISIMHSKREGIFYLEHCRILMRDDRVDFAIDKESAGTYYWNLPTANTSVLLLGSGTSITQAAARRLSEDGVMFAFVGGGGTPLFLASQSEYRPTEYCQQWFKLWVDPASRLKMAKHFQLARQGFVSKAWSRLEELKKHDVKPDVALQPFLHEVTSAKSNQELMQAEARCAKRLYAVLANHFGIKDFIRDRSTRVDSDTTNSFLDHGNYLAYGLAAACLWTLGIPHSLPISHGMTRRGALVFDVADLVKDGIIMPLAFSSAAAGKTDREFRERCIHELQRLDALEFMFDQIKHVSLGMSEA